MIKYRIFSDYNTSAGHAAEIYNMWNHDDNDHDEDMCFVSDDSYTHAVIINDCTPNVLVDKSKVIWLSHEPSSIKSPNDSYIRNVACKHIGHGHGYEEGPTFLSAWVPPLEKPNTFNGSISIIASNKIALFGHRYRHELIGRILDTDMDIHIFGRGIRYSDSRCKGEIQDKKHGIYGYDYHIAIENEYHEYWITEKILDCYSSWSMPIYYGSSYANRAFRDSLHRLTGNIDEDMNTIKSLYGSKPDLSGIELARNEIWRKGGEYHYPTYLYNFARRGEWTA